MAISTAALLLLGHSLPGFTQQDPGRWRYCYQSTCYDSLSEAESAMKSQTCGSELEPVGDPIISEHGSFTRSYAIPTRDAIIDEDYFKFVANWPGYCGHVIPNLQASWCGTAQEAIAKSQQVATQQGHCDLQYQTGQNAHGGAFAVNQQDIGGLRHFNTFQDQIQPPPCTITIGRWYCNTGVHESGCELEKATDSHCPICRTPPAWMPATFPKNVCGNPLTAQILGHFSHEPVDCDDKVGNPCVPSNGAKLLEEHDFEFGGFRIGRRYHSLSHADDRARLGHKWFYPWGSRVLLQNGSQYRVFVLQPDFTIEQFDPAGADVFISRGNAGAIVRKLPNNAGWRLEPPSDTWVEYDATGRFQRMYDPDRIDRSISATYDEFGFVTELVSLAGRKLKLEYADGRLQKILLPRLGLPVFDEIAFRYLNGRHLDRVTRQDGSYREYLYEMTNQPGLVTGINDEMGHRTSTYQYDKRDRVIMSTRLVGATEVGKIQLSYSATQTFVTMPLGDVVTYTYAQSGDNLFRRLINVSDGAGPRTFAYHPTSGVRTQYTDRNNNVTTYQYTSLRQLSIMTEAVGTTVQRETETQWATGLNRPSSISVRNAANALEARERFAYNSRGQVGARCVVDPALPAADGYVCGASANAPTGVRQTRQSYCEQTSVTCSHIGLLAEVDGARTDVVDITSLSYRTADDASCASSPSTCPYRKGDLWKVTNAVGHVTEAVSRDPAGRVISRKDPNGVFADQTYHARGWPTHQKVRGTNEQVETDDAVTQFQYDLAGNTTKVTQPDGSYLAYTYDGAGRLTRITDRTGAYIQFELDSAGNRQIQKTYTASSVLKQRIAREFDVLSRLHRERDALNASGVTLSGAAVNDPTQGRLGANHAYDGNGNRIETIDGLGYDTDQVYDPLNRLVSTLDALRPQCPASDVNCGKTQYAFDARDNLISVTDPKGLITHYTRDGLNSLTALNSPDTGVTLYANDAAGNRISQTDARGVTTTFGYDALNRLQSTAYPSAPLNVTNQYDQLHSVCPIAERFNTGKLSTILDASGSTKFCHDRFGNEVRRISIVGSATFVTRSSYDLAGNLTQLIYPSGLVVGYTRDQAARISSVTAGGTLIASASYLPMGPLQNLAFGDGSTLARQYDANYAIDRIDASVAVGLDLDYTTDVTGNITGLTDIVGGAPTNVYSYDALYRLTQVRDQSGTNIEKYTYDATGNRTSKQVGLAAAVAYTYPPTSHRLSSVGGVGRTYDPAGNTTSLTNQVGNWTLAYDQRNRLTQISQAGGGPSFTLQYNGLWQRASSAAGIHVYARNGQNLADYFGDLTISAEYVWIDGLLVGYRPNHNLSSAFFYVHSDHVGTPRRIVTAKSKSIPSAMVWDWQLLGNPFGDQPASASELCPPFGPCYQVQFNLRFPGQFADSTGLHYNYFRDYEPAVGRYVESDPVGQLAGASTYGYVLQNPLQKSDPMGLATGGELLLAGVIRCIGGAGASTLTNAGWQTLRCCRDDCGSWDIRNCNFRQCFMNLDTCEARVAMLGGCIVGAVRPELAPIAGMFAKWYLGLFNLCTPRPLSTLVGDSASPSGN